MFFLISSLLTPRVFAKAFCSIHRCLPQRYKDYCSQARQAPSHLVSPPCRGGLQGAHDFVSTVAHGGGSVHPCPCEGGRTPATGGSTLNSRVHVGQAASCACPVAVSLTARGKIAMSTLLTSPSRPLGRSTMPRTRPLWSHTWMPASVTTHRLPLLS